MNLQTAQIIQVQIVAGTGTTKFGAALQPGFVAEQLKSFEEELAAKFPGFSRTTGTGGWRNTEGQVVYEANVVYTMFVSGTPTHKLLANAFAVQLRDRLIQDCVCLTITPVYFDLV